MSNPLAAHSGNDNQLDFRLLVESVTDYGILMLDPDGYVQSWNAGLTNLQGYNATEIIGQPFSSLFAPNLEQNSPAHILNIAATEGQFVGEVWRLHQDGSKFLAHLSITALRDQKGQLQGFAEVTRRLSAAPQVEGMHQLQQRNKELEAIFEAFPDLYFRIDAQGLILDFHQGQLFASQDLYVSPELSLGKPMQAVLPPEVGEQMYIALAQVIETQQMVSMEYTLPMESGQRSYEARLLPLPDQQVLVLVRDISDRQRLEAERQHAEDALRASEAELMTLFGAMQDVILVLDAEGRYLKIAPSCAPLLYRPSLELVGKRMHEVIPADSANFFLQYIHQTLKTRETINLEYSLPIGDQLLWFDASMVALTEDSVLWVAREVTTRKQAEADLKDSEAQLREKTQQLEATLAELKRTQMQIVQSEKMSSLGQLVAGVAHEINNPVNFIYGNLSHANEYTQDLIGLVQLYQQAYPSPAPQVQAEAEAIDLDFLVEDLPKLLSSMKVGTDRIRQIVISLRNFSRTDEAEMKAVDLHEGIDSTLMILQHRLKPRHDHPAIAVVKDYADLPLVECYTGQLNQVFMNILSNAIDAIEERDHGRTAEEIEQHPGEIKISTHPINFERVQICISDNGIGMSTAVQQHLFDPFFTTKPVGSGTGLGMSISYQIITEKHRGRLTCRSELGQGTTFAIEIPIHQGSSFK